MKLCHLYNKTGTFAKVGAILDAFDEKVSVDISSVSAIDDANIYIFEAAKVDKAISAKLKILFESKSHPLIYFLIEKEYNLMLFQLAFLLKVKTLITANQDINKVIARMHNELKIHEDEYIQSILGKTIVKTQDFMLFKDHRLYLASKKLYEDFMCRNLGEIEKKICSQLDLDKLLSSDMIMQKSIVNDANRDIEFHVQSTTINTQNDKLLLFEPYIRTKSSPSKLSFIANRLSFIEMLKDKIIEKSISQKPLSIITIEIENIQKLQIDLSEEALQELIKELLLKVEVMLDKKLILAQYNKDFYVSLFEDISFEKLQEKAQIFHTQLIKIFEEKKFSPMVGVYAFNINDFELNKVLGTLKNILDKSLSQKEINNGTLKYINSVDAHMNSDEAIMVLLESAFTNRVEFKLFNIYKGLCINTSSKILKMKDDLVYVKFEQLQGIVMKHEGETILQSSNFSKDIRAKVKYVNLEKRIAILENFEFSKSNANERQYSRVTCSTRTPVVLSHLSGTVNGEILDISVKSIAMKTKNTRVLKNIQDAEITLSFVLPTHTNEDGFVRLVLKAKTTFINCRDDGECKVVCDLLKDDVSESILMEYIYHRQKEIIVEVKKMAKWI